MLVEVFGDRTQVLGRKSVVLRLVFFVLQKFKNIARHENHPQFFTLTNYPNKYNAFFLEKCTFF